jgi:hypothetical protein
MTKEKLLAFYDSKLSFKRLVYKTIPFWKRAIQNLTLLFVFVLFALPSLELTIGLDKPEVFWIKLIKLALAGCAGWAMVHLTLYLYGRNTAREVKRNKKFKHCYVSRTKVDWNKFKKWQRVKMFDRLEKWGFNSKAEIESLHRDLGDWMKRERFSLVSYAALFGAVGLPLWAAFLSSVFDKDVVTLDDRLLMLLLLTMIIIVVCAAVRMFNEIYNTSFSKHSRISDIRDLLEDIIMNYNDLR